MQRFHGVRNTDLATGLGDPVWRETRILQMAMRATGFLAAAVGGAAMGATVGGAAGKPGLAAGAVCGGLAGALACRALAAQGLGTAYHDAEFDDTIGIGSGDRGTSSSPPRRRMCRGTSSSGRQSTLGWCPRRLPVSRP